MTTDIDREILFSNLDAVTPYLDGKRVMVVEGYGDDWRLVLTQILNLAGAMILFISDSEFLENTFSEIEKSLNEYQIAAAIIHLITGAEQAYLDVVIRIKAIGLPVVAITGGKPKPEILDQLDTHTIAHVNKYENYFFHEAMHLLAHQMRESENA